MTAYAQASVMEDQINVDVDIRPYNSRHLDLVLYLPRSCRRFEDEIRKLVSGTVARGRVEIRITLEDTSQDSVRFEVDENRARAYYKALSQLEKMFSLESGINLDTLLGGKEMIRVSEGTRESETQWQVLSNALTTALAALDAMRSREGNNLAEDFEKRINFMEDELEKVKKLSKTIPLIYRERLLERIASLTSGVENLDPVRISQEAAMLADKSDISEEIVRAWSHSKQFRETILSDEPGGRKLNFLVQEFNREFNTMGSKAGKAELSHIIVGLKSELEKIREQVQNIE